MKLMQGCLALRICFITPSFMVSCDKAAIRKNSGTSWLGCCTA